MTIFRCPECKNRTVTWDARAQSFLCYNAQCKASFPPPEFAGMSFDDVVIGLSLNRLNVTQEDIDRRLMRCANATAEHDPHAAI